MGGEGRKLTIRMPDNPRLREAGVGGMHVDPGGRVAKGSPVMTLVARRASHIVRAPRSGKIVPLVAVDDRVVGGDPLFILHLDEEALAEANRAARALVPVQRPRWDAGAEADDINPVARQRKTQVLGLGLGLGGAWRWARVVLAGLLYVLACFVVLPLLHLFGASAPAWAIGAMCLGAVLFGGLIWKLYQPTQGMIPRLAVQAIAISWVGMAAVAIFWRPEVDGAATVARAPPQITVEVTAEDPSQPDATLAAAEGPQGSGGDPVGTDVPATTAAPLPVASAGLAPGAADRPIRPPSAPVSALGSLGQGPADHGVVVRVWARVQPGRGAGAPVLAPPAERALVAVPASGAPEVLATVNDQTIEAPPLSDELLQLAARRDPSGPAAAPKVSVLLGEGPVPREVASVAPTLPRPSATAVGWVDLIPVSGPGTAPATPLAPPVSGVWLAEAGIAVMMDEALAAPSMSEQPQTRIAALSPSEAGVTRQSPGSRLAGLRGIDPVRARSRLAGGAGWIDDQLLQLASLEVRSPGTSPAVVPVGTPVRPIAVAMPAPPVLSARPRIPWLQDLEIDLVDRGSAPRQPGWSAPIAEHLVGPSRASVGALDLDTEGVLVAAALPVAPEIGARPRAPTRLDLEIDLVKRGALPGRPAGGEAWKGPHALKVTAPAGRPALDPEGPQGPAVHLAAVARAPMVLPSPGPAPAMRELLFLYVDDPRRAQQPGLGAAWTPDLPVDTGLLGSRIVEVRPLIQVSSWCPAAGGATGGEELREIWVDDRVRLMRVVLWLEPEGIATLEQALPVFAGGPPGFFHNRLPLMGGLPGEALMDRGLGFVRQMSNAFMDPNAPFESGGQYYDDPDALIRAAKDAGCGRAIVNGGNGPTGPLGARIHAGLRG